MRVPIFISLFASSLLVIASPVGDPAQPDVIATAVFPADNQLGRITNGKSNKLQVGIENKSAQNITITSIGGSLHHPETGKLYKNTSTLTYGIPLLHGAKISLPYNFYSEFSTGERRLDVWVNHASPDGKFRVPAYSSVVTIVEGSSSWKEPATLFTLLLGLGLLGGIGYAAQQLLTPEKKVKKAKVSEPIVVTATGAGGYQEEWIPEGHLKKSGSRSSRKKTGGAVTSGDEVTSGAESGAEKRRRK